MDVNFCHANSEQNMCKKLFVMITRFLWASYVCVSCGIFNEQEGRWNHRPAPECYESPKTVVLSVLADEVSSRANDRSSRTSTSNENNILLDPDVLDNDLRALVLTVMVGVLSVVTVTPLRTHLISNEPFPCLRFKDQLKWIFINWKWTFLSFHPGGNVIAGYFQDQVCSIFRLRAGICTSLAQNHHLTVR